MIDEMFELVSKLEKGVNALKINGNKFAQADRDYRVALAKEILIQRASGIPATLISDTCRGTESIADLRLKRDIAEINYKTNLEAINAYKVQIRVIENQIEREWGQSGRQ